MRRNLNFDLEKIVVGLVFLFGVGIRLIQASSGFWHDEAASLIISTGTPFSVLTHLKGDFHPPLFYWILNYWMSFAGKSEAVIRLPFILLSSIAIPLTYVLAKRMTGSNLGAVWSSALLAVNPLHVYYSTELRMYGLATTLCVASWLMLYSDKSKKNLIWYLLATVAGLFTFYGLWFSFAAQIVIMLQQRRYKWMLISMFFSLGLLLWWWPILKIQLTGSAFMQTTLPGWSTLSGDLSAKSLILIPLKWVIGRLNLSGDRSLMFSSFGALGYVVFVSIWALKNKKSKDLLLAIGLPILLSILISLKAPMLGYWRYIYLIPFFCVVLSVGLLSMDRYNRYLNFGALFTIFLFCNITYFMTPRYWREDWAGVAEFFRPIQGTNTVAIYTFFDAFPAAKWYLSEIPSAAVLNDLRSSKENFDERMAEVAAGKDTIIVFDYLNDLTDRDRSVLKWLQLAGYQEKGVYSFRGVGQVFEYRPSK